MNEKNKTQIKIYWNYFKYVMKHKWNVFLECLFVDPCHGITHDLSKFQWIEFKGYANIYCGGDYYKYGPVENDYELAWLHHIHNNKHHWQYWVLEGKPIPMPDKYVRQMVCDWRGMSCEFSDTALEFYKNQESKMLLHDFTRDIILDELGV